MKRSIFSSGPGEDTKFGIFIKVTFFILAMIVVIPFALISNFIDYIFEKLNKN